MSSAPPDSGGWGFGSPVPTSGDAADYQTKHGGPLVDTGFGNPTDTKWKGYYDTVTPTPVTAIPGFGNLKNDPNVWIPIALRLLPDDGGPLLELWGEWADYTYRIRFKSNPGGVLFPAAPDYAFAAVPGSVFDIVPNPPLEFLRVTVPPMPVGDYDVVVYWGANFGASLSVDSAIEVLIRTRQQAVYRLRSAQPPIYKTGPRSQADEELL